MATLTIDGINYDSNDLTDEAKAQLASLQFCDAELQRLQAEAASIQTARMVYANALKAELDKLRGKAAAQINRQSSVDSATEPTKETEKKGLFGGLFGKK